MFVAACSPLLLLPVSSHSCRLPVKACIQPTPGSKITRGACVGVSGSVVECSPATRTARVRFPADALFLPFFRVPGRRRAFGRQAHLNVRKCRFSGMNSDEEILKEAATMVCHAFPRVASNAVSYQLLDRTLSSLIWQLSKGVVEWCQTTYATRYLV